ncbi:uncharacterized protein K02A2.6 [Trichonephila clavipes]|nr:uncharacterized protein K02A2.6 [Trichonephila clavipes]
MGDARITGSDEILLRERNLETGKDIGLGPLLKALREGNDLQGREAQYTIEDGYIMYGQRVCILKKFQKYVLEELHAGHLGIIKMKAIDRSFVYWKIIDKDIGEAAKNFVDCARHKTDPTKTKVHYWEYPSMPWERVHVDFAGPIFKHTFFLHSFQMVRNISHEDIQEEIGCWRSSGCESFQCTNTNTWYHCKPGWSTSLHRRCLRNLEITTSRGSKKQPKYSACRNSGRSEQGIGFVPEVPSTDVAVPDVSPSSAKVTKTRSPPIPGRPFPRRSGRRPPKRLGL